MSDIESKVKSILVNLGIDENKINPGATFKNDLDLDSLEQVEFISEMEREFDMIILDDEAELILTVGDALSYVEKASCLV